ncbi:MAG: winged helix-turn-helix transcriptional regulator [Candidatus Kariarchaeaceae archaeon]
MKKRPKLLMHPIRLEIYKFVSETPGSHLYEIIDNLEIPQGTITWHLRKMSESGLIDTVKIGGRRAFFSKALRGVDTEQAFAMLKSNKAKEIFLYIVKNTSCYQTEMAKDFDLHHDTIRHHCERLESVGLIKTHRDGRVLHHQVGETGKKILTSNIELISHAYISHLTTKLKDECLTPIVEEYSDDSLTMRISCAGYDDVTLKLKLKDWEFIQDIVEGTIEDDNESE